MFHIDPADPTPVEAQLVRTVRSAVAAGLLSAGDALPTVRHLAVELRVNANAVERAYAALAREGVVVLRPGVGVFVSASALEVGPTARLEELAALEDTFLREASALGFSLDEVIIHLDSRRKA
ncbi:MAG: GntR family transcriptional regulator [Gemmatimonadetes bacterium]|nr:GntR family transcriptional regulator [Gemmatimonadota bacterium]